MVNDQPLDLDADSWERLYGAFRLPYDPRDALARLEAEDAASAWSELWDELHHQGDVGTASYASVPHLVRIHLKRDVQDWNTYALVYTIERARRSPANPDLPTSLAPAYGASLDQLLRRGLFELETATDALLVSSILALVAEIKGQPKLAELASRFDEDERAEILSDPWGTDL